MQPSGQTGGWIPPRGTGCPSFRRLGTFFHDSEITKDKDMEEEDNGRKEKFLEREREQSIQHN